MSRAFRHLTLAAALSATIGTAAGGDLAAAPEAGPIACGVAYTIAQGDTLFLIAERAYGDGWQYRQVFKANADLLPDPESIEVGDQILLPCADGSGPATRREALATGVMRRTDLIGGIVSLADTGIGEEEAERQARNEQTIEQNVAGGTGGAIATDRAIGIPQNGPAAPEPAPGYEGPARASSGPDRMDSATGVGTRGTVADAILSVPATAESLALAAVEPAIADMPVSPAPPQPLAGSATWSAAELLQRAAQLVARSALPAGMIVAPTAPEPARILPHLAAPADGIARDPVPASLTDTQTAMPPPGALRLLTGSGFAPYADRTLDGGGMITEMVRRAVQMADPGRPVSVSFIDDWPAHLDILLPQGAFDVGFPWFKPDCGTPGRLGPQMRARCSDLEFSNALFEVQVGSYTRKGDPLERAGDAAALAGKTLCRPSGQFSFDLEQSGLTEPNVRLVRPNSALACFAMLIRGQVDIVTMTRQEAGEEIVRRGFADAVAEVDGLLATQTLHAVVAKSNPNARAHLDLINRGLAALMASGRWFEIVAYHQRAQLALAQ